MVSTGHRSTAVGFICPSPLADWLNEEAARRRMSLSRLVATLVLDYSGLDIELQQAGRPPEDIYKKNVREIGEATGQVPIRSLRGTLGY